MESNALKENQSSHVCPHQIAFMLDNPFRRLFQNPKKILKPYIADGSTAMDIGCGPGFFTIDMAKLVGPEGKVIAVDLQEKMLSHVRKKAKKHNVEDRIQFFKCEQDRIGYKQKADFILALYMVHETPSPRNLLEEMKAMINENGKIFIAEPKMHVSKEMFEDLISLTKEVGFKILDYPKKMGGRSVLIGIKD
ncbi:MAG: class I SAM-dependent methyltransferase [Desulfobacteraceae bacterium]|jgi:ubiquinone/menaquinone biosynthesis C-methylase UbiE